MEELLEKYILENKLLQSKILSFRPELEDRFYPELVEIYDKHFEIQIDREGKI